MAKPGSKHAYVQPIEVCLRDLDGLGHVNNAVFLTYLETARNRYLFDLRGRSGLAGFDFILARTAIDFRSPASLHESLHVGLRPTRIGTSSFDLEYEVREATTGRLVTQAESVQVMYNYAAARPMPIEEPMRRLLLAEIERTAGATPARLLAR